MYYCKNFLCAAVVLMLMPNSIANAQELFRIQSNASQKCFDIPNGNRSNNIPLNQFRCDGSPEQNFYIRETGGGYANVISASTGKCMDIPNGSTLNGIGVNQFECDGSAEQQFRVEQYDDGTFDIIARHSGKCLEVPGGSQSL